MSAVTTLPTSSASIAWNRPDSLLVTWRHPRFGSYFLMGTLRQDADHSFVFSYLPDAVGSRDFSPLPGFPDTSRIYRSRFLFPLFSSRLMSKKRIDRPGWLDSFGLDDRANDLDILARTSGGRVTDNVRFLREPVVDETLGVIRGRSPLHGVRHVPGASDLLLRGELSVGDSLVVQHEANNQHDSHARLVLTEAGRRIGYLPRPLLQYLDRRGLLTGVPDARVCHVNAYLPDASQQVEITFDWPVAPKS